MLLNKLTNKLELLDVMINENFIERTSEVLKNINIDFYKKILVFNKLISTNTKAKKFAEDGEPEGTVVIAKIQEQGRGRFDRVWKSPEGGLYISIILKPNFSPDKTTLLPLVTANAVSETIRNFGISAHVKWPNDIRINNKKIAGILLESSIYKNEIKHVVLGIGINLNIDINIFPKNLINSVTSISNELGNRIDYYDFLKQLLISFDKWYLSFLKQEFNKIILKWKHFSDTLNKRVLIRTPSGEVIGKAYDVDESGFLIVYTDSGEYKKIMSGDCLYFNEL